VALIAAGTATLQAAMLRTPMVAMYNLNWFRANLLIRPMTTSNTYALPNMIAEAAGQPWVVPEFVPHSGDPRPLVEALTLLLAGTHRRAAQREALRAITEPYEHVRFADAATQCVLQLAGYTTQ
jgi:lipid A disaccharide synthetase